MSGSEQDSGHVMIGMDPHKRSVTIEVMDADETVLDKGRFDTGEAGFAAMRSYVSRFADRVWAIEGCNGIGRHVAIRLLAAGEDVVDVPPKLSARARVPMWRADRRCQRHASVVDRQGVVARDPMRSSDVSRRASSG